MCGGGGGVGVLFISVKVTEYPTSGKESFLHYVNVSVLIKFAKYTQIIIVVLP